MPRGGRDVVEADLARESVDEVVDALRELGCVRRGGVVLEALDTVVSDAADRAEQAAPGQRIDAVVWDELLSRTGQGARLSVTGLAAPTRPARIPPFDAGGPVESLG